MAERDLAISLIRGINVSGQKKLPMAELRAALTEAGLDGVRTYIQSGNVLCESPARGATAAGEIVQRTIAEAFGYEVDVITLTPWELESVLDRNPFLSPVEPGDERKLGYALLREKPEPAKVDGLDRAQFAPDELAVHDRVAYIRVQNGFGTSKLSTNYIESRLHVRATMRNHRTMIKLLEMARE